MRLERNHAPAAGDEMRAHEREIPPVGAGVDDDHAGAEERLREAEFQLAKSQSRADIGWSVGIRQFQDTDDTALVAGVSVPLFSSTRNAGALQSAQATRDEVAVQRESALLALRATLFDAFQQRKLGIETAELLRNDVIPALTRALQLTRTTYESGRYG